MEYGTLVWLGGFVFAYALLAERIAHGPLTLALVATAIGVAVGVAGVEPPVPLARGVLLEVTLALLLFGGGVRLRLRRARRRHRGPLRLLLVALPLSVLLGTAAAVALFPGIALVSAVVMAAALATTDTGLCAPALRPPSESDPLSTDLRLEEALSEGLAIVLVELALGAHAFPGRPALSVLAAAAQHLGLAALIGVAVGLAGGWALALAQRREPIRASVRALAGAGVALVALAVAHVLGVKALTAPFVAGIAFGWAQGHVEEDIEETEPFQGGLLFVLAFVTLGATAIPEALERASWRTAAYVAASLTVVRAIPVLLSYLGSGIPAREVAYVAWFGPRGLAAILIGRVLVERSDLPGRDVALVTIVTAVAASVVLHGLTAAPLSGWRARPGRAGEALPPRRAAEVPP